MDATQIGIALALEASFASYMGANYRGAHAAARTIFANRFLCSRRELQAFVAEELAARADRARYHRALGGSAETLVAIEAIEQEGAR